MMNLELLAMQNPVLAKKLEKHSIDPLHIQICQTANEINLQILQPSPFYVHAETGPRQEAKQWFESLSLSNTDVLFIFGIGLGYFYEPLQIWLKANQNRCLVFLEPDLDILHLLLQTELGTNILKDPQVDIFYFPEGENEQTAFIQDIVGDHILKSYQFSSLPSYQREYEKIFHYLQQHIAFEEAEQRIGPHELSQFGFQFFNNYYRNLFQIPSAYNGHALFGKFKKMPAIICGAGSSLLKSIPLLKQLESRALLFGPGSAMNILNAHDIWPHFGINIDPTAETYHRIATDRAYEIPFFYRNRVYYEALEAIHGPHLLLQGTGLYPVVDWFDEQLNLPSDNINEGYNIIHTALETAYRLGCDPIIFVGVDNSFTERHYATGIEKHPLFPSNNLDDKPHMGKPITLKDTKGQIVQSYWPWIIQAHWCDYFHRSHPEVTLINASEGGIGLFSIPNQSLESVADQYLQHNYDFQELINQQIHSAGLLPVDRKKIKDCIYTFGQSLKVCEGLCQQLYDEAKNGNEKEATSKSLKASLGQEIGFNYLLTTFNDFYLKYTQRNRRNLERFTPEKSKELLHKILEENRFLFLLQTIKINLQIIDIAIREEEDREQLQGLQQQSQSIKLPNKADIEKGKAFYYPSGALYSLQFYVDGLKDGKHLYYYADGNLKTMIEYKKGQLDGEVVLYYPSGKIKHIYHFRKGQRHGLEKSWFENGQLFTEIEYEENKPVSASCWYKDGTLGKKIP